MGKQIIAVAGATGSQGGGLVRAILAEPEAGFSVRALTRDPGSEKARELERLGAEVVKADLDDAGSLRKAFRGAFGVFRRGTELVGKRVGIAGEFLTGGQTAAALGGALGQEVVYRHVPPEVYRTFGFPGADDLGNMLQYKRDFEAEFCGARDLALSRALNPRLQTFAGWLAANEGKIPVE